MQTSYYARCKDKKDSNVVSISRKAPTWFEGRSYLKLAPTKRLLELHWNSLPNDEFEKLYREIVLDKLDPIEVYNELGPDAILVCHEKPGRFCHRHIVARWLMENIPGLVIKELPLEGGWF